MPMPRQWYRFALADGDAPAVADLYIFDMIGGWIDDYWQLDGVTTAKTFLDELAKLPESVKTLRVHVNSPGGDVYSAVTIANMLRAQSTEKKRTVEMSIEGLAASAASVIICAGDVIRIADNALVMIHNPWSWAVGSADEMRKAAEDLDKCRGQIIATYRWVSSRSEAELIAMMDATTWLDAEEALAAGFATEIVSGMKAAAAIAPAQAAKLGAVPDKYRDRLAALVRAEDVPAGEPTPTPAPAPETEPPPADEPVAPAAVIRACLAAGFPALAEPLVATTVTQAQLDARLARARETAALCKAAKLDTLAAGYVQADVPIATVQAQLTELRARLAGVEIDPSLAPDTGRAPVRIDAAAIYARHNQPQPVGGATR